MVGANIGSFFKPVACCLGQNLPLIGDAGQNAVKGANAISGNDDAAAIGQIVIFPHLATIVIGQIGF